jgi:hypothetical protein
VITKEIALTTRNFEHLALRNADGSPLRCRANGACKTWVTRPLDFRLPVKSGIRGYFYIERIVDGFHPGGYGNWTDWVPAGSVTDRSKIKLVLYMEMLAALRASAKDDPLRDIYESYIRYPPGGVDLLILGDLLEDRGYPNLAQRVRSIEDYMK